MIPTGYLFPDVSGYVKVTDWPAFARAHPVAACKVSEGATWPSRREDDYWSEFQANCRKHGILPVGYHFLTRAANLNEQVANYLRRLDGGPVGIALDVETAGNGTNPTVEQADQWLTAVAQRTGRPRAHMLTYMPRWWWLQHGGGSTALRDTICWLSDYGPTRNMRPYAGWSEPLVLQFSSTAPGAGMPPGDMNVAVGMTASQLAARLGLASNNSPEDEPMSAADVQALKDWLWEVLVHGSPGHPRMATVDDLAPLAQEDRNNEVCLEDIKGKLGELAAAVAEIKAGL